MRAPELVAERKQLWWGAAAVEPRRRAAKVEFSARRSRSHEVASAQRWARQSPRTLVREHIAESVGAKRAFPSARCARA
jgi:hypothetical protein